LITSLAIKLAASDDRNTTVSAMSSSSQEFSDASALAKGHAAKVTATKALAMTAIDLFTDTELMTQTTEEFKKNRS